MEERVVKQNYKKLYPTAFILYLSFFVHGFGAAILSQNTTSLQALWSTDAAGVLYVISALGIGRLITYPFSGAISDKFGRRLTVIIGCLVYICFFGGKLIFINCSKCSSCILYSNTCRSSKRIFRLRCNSGSYGNLS